MKIKTLEEKINKIKDLLDDPHPGLFSWQTTLAYLMNDMIQEWKNDDLHYHKASYSDNGELTRYCAICDLDYMDDCHIKQLPTEKSPVMHIPV